MAKKTIKTEENVIENNKEVVKKDMSSLSIKELIDYESACRIICSYYDNIIRRYDNTISLVETNESKKLMKYNLIHKSILESMEKKFCDLL